jgi:hypothetical protein
MMKCEEARSVISSWVEGDLDDRRYREFKAHIGTCQECAFKFQSLTLLMEKDLGKKRAYQAEDTEEFTEAVMASLPDSKKSGSVIRFRNAFPSPVLAAAAAAIFVLGLGFGIFFTKLNTNRTTIRFTIAAPDAQSVHLAGNFNRWNNKTYELRRVDSGGTWEIELRLAKGSFYVYNYIIDGETWVADPEVPLKIEDGFGGSSSLLRL